MDLLRRTAPSASPAQRKKKMSCAHEAHVSTRTARWRRPARSSRSRSRRWQASGGEPGGEEGVCPAALRAAGSLQASSRPGDPYQLPQHGIMQRCLRWQVSRTRRAGEALLPRSPSASAVRRAGVAGTARWRKCGPAAQRRANGVAYSADNRASDALRRLLEVVPRGLRRLWDGAPAPITLAQFPARHHLAGKIRFPHPALYYNYPLSQGGCTFWEHD